MQVSGHNLSHFSKNRPSFASRIDGTESRDARWQMFGTELTLSQVWHTLSDGRGQCAAGGWHCMGAVVPKCVESDGPPIILSIDC